MISFQKSNAQFIPSPTNGECEELFFSELTFGKNPNGTLWDLNYAVEIYNPTQSAINLSSYSLVLTDLTQNIVTIPLTGTINSGDVYVVSNSNADLNLQSLADHLSTNLDFGNYACLELKNNGNVIDKIGQKFNNNPNGSFDVAQFIQDPYGYLQNYDIKLDDYENVDVRRSYFDKKGDTVFSPAATAILGHWAFYFNTDRSNIGTHKNICTPEAGDFYIGYLTNGAQVPAGLNFNLFNPGDAHPLTIYYPNNSPTNTYPFDFITKHTYDPTSTATFQKLPPYNNNANFLLGYTLNGNPPPPVEESTESYCIQSKTNGGNIGGSCEAIYYNSNLTITPPSAYVRLELTSNTQNVIVNQPTKYCYIYLNKWATGIESIDKENITIYPTSFKDIVRLKLDNDYSYQLVNSTGAIYKYGHIKQNETSLNFNSIANGLYFLTLSNNNKHVTFKLVKE